MSAGIFPPGTSFNRTVTVTAPVLRRYGKPPVVNGVLAATAVWPKGEVSKYNIPKGCLLGLNSSTGLYHPIRGTQFAATEGNGQTTISVDDAGNIEVGDNVKACTAAAIVEYGVDTGVQDLGAVTAVDTTSTPNTVTVTTAVTGSGFADGDYLYVAPATDHGQEIVAGILINGVRSIDIDGNAVANQIGVLTRYHLDTIKLIYEAPEGFVDEDLIIEDFCLTGKNKAELLALFGINFFV